MPFPKRVQAALAETDTSDLPGSLALEQECAGAKFHSPTPLLLHEVEVGGERLLLCGICRSSLEVLQHLLRQNDGNLPWPVRREFGNRIRALALKGWEVQGDDQANEDEVASV